MGIIRNFLIRYTILKNIPILLIILACLVSYFNTLSALFVYDDNILIVDNPYIKSFRFLPLYFSHDICRISKHPMDSIYYRPLLAASFMWDYAFWRLVPFGYHLTNLISHILISISVFLFAEILFKNRLISSFSSLLFSVHPIHTEAVSFISARVDVLCLLFFLVSLILFLKYIFDKKFIFYLLSLFSFFVSLLIKEMAVTLPLVVLCIDYLFLTQQKIKAVFKNFLRLHLGFFIILAVYFLIHAFFAGWKYDTNYGRIFLAIKTLVKYIELLFFPVGLHLLYVPSVFDSWFKLDIILGIIILSSLLFLIILNLKKSVILSFSIIWFFITILPVSNIWSKGIIFAERYMYMPSVGFCIAIGFLFSRLLNKDLKTHWLNLKKSIYFVFFLLIVALGRFTFERNKVWNNEFSLWYETVKAFSQNATAHFNLGNAYAKINFFDQAIEEYNLTLKLDPGRLPSVSHNLGTIYLKKGLIDEAIKAFKMAVNSPQAYTAIPYNNLATAYNRKGQYKEAIEAGLVALKYNPYFDDAHYNLALSYSKMGFIEEAIKEYEAYLKINPEYYSAHVDIGHLYYKKGDCQKAKEHWLKALKISKDYKPAKDALKSLCQSQEF